MNTCYCIERACRYIFETPEQIRRWHIDYKYCSNKKPYGFDWLKKSKLKTKFTPLNDLLAPRMMVTTSYTGQKAVSSLMKHDEYSYRKQFHTQFPSID